MQLFSCETFVPKIDSSNYIAEGVKIIGNVVLESQVNIWHNCVLRADINSIYVGENTNIQDLSLVHVTQDLGVKIGKNTTIGHSAVIHACTIGDGCLIGMGAKILDGAVIGDNCLVAAGSVVPPGKVYPAGSFIRGLPAKFIRELSAQEVEQISTHYLSYIENSRLFKNNVKLIKS
ncbi:MAG: gamma carbonic anhydrase family protein [Bacteriovoracaceae bacterium]|jgi:carbonic anhydrase/acetyltransferase-like protein (isoleucine patch superfamily)|nr:gamma carbonic anhydrase family protein [Halobacteriovoraceae bacterium]MDP7320025.1 gamma carbonic anhydrase family protein [Bacteriovoracaceae bacterium]